MLPRDETIEANGLRFRAVVLAAGPALPVLLLHATSFCADVWTPVWAACAEAGGEAHAAIAVDVRGHGRSDAPDAAEDYTWTRLVDDALALAEEVGDGRGVVLAGHSSGATAALVAAARRPDLVRAVAVFEPVLYDAPPAGADADSFAGSRELARRARKRRDVFASRDEARAYLGARFPYSGFASAALEAYLVGGFAPAEGEGVRLRCRPEIEAAVYDGAAALDLADARVGAGTPLLVVIAQHSAVPRAQLEALLARTPAPTLVRVQGATHFVALERPEAVGRALGGFLSAQAGVLG
jgi:pimeloyl-ACP methyl ester carboxylesterase